MANIRKKLDTAWLVAWREGHGRDAPKRYKQFRSEAEAIAYKQEGERRLAPPVEDPFSNMGASAAELAFAEDHPEYLVGVRHDFDEELGLARYIRRMVEGDRELRTTTRDLYLRNLRVHLEGTELGRADVRSITPQQLSRWWASLDLGIGARRNVIQLLSKAFNRAVLVGDREDNPLRRAPEVRRPSKRRQREVEPLTVAQVEALTDAAAVQRRGGLSGMARQRDRITVLLMGFAGLRAGEVGGLRAQDLSRDGDKCLLRVRQAAIRESGRTYVGEPKSRSSRRTISIPCSLMDEVQAFLSEHPPAQDGRIIHGPNGEVRAHTDINHAVAAAGKRLGFDVNSHQLRHTAVSLLISAGANLKQVQAFVGHASITETADTYGQLVDETGGELARILEGLRVAHRNGT